jgi:hypothetical protein
MLTSFFSLHQSISKLSRSIKELQRHKGDQDKQKLYVAVGWFAIAVLVFMLELYLLFYLLKYVYKSSSGNGRNVRIVLLVFFTIPFALLAATVDPDFSLIVNER